MARSNKSRAHSAFYGDGPTDLLEAIDAHSEGWSAEDLKAVRSSAEDQKSGRSSASIKAAAENALASRRNGSASQDFSQQLFSLNPSAHLIKESKNYLVVELAVNFRVPKLPAGYGFKGGAARNALLHLLGHDTRKLVARDFDVVRFSIADAKLDQQVAQRFMPEDFRFGHGVEVVSSLETYFQTRDLTINEVLLIGKKILFSKTAFGDLKEFLIRPSSYLLSSKEGVTPKIACKMLRLVAEFGRSNFTCQLEHFPHGVEVSAFDVELHRKRAAASGQDVEKDYLELASQMLQISGVSTKPIPAKEPSRQASLSLRPQNGIPKLRRRF